MSNDLKLPDVDQMPLGPGGFPIEGLVLGSGAHDTRAEGVCVMEAVAWFAGERHTDRPQCVDEALMRIGIAVNDALDDEERQRLVPLIPRLAGTTNDGQFAWRKQRLLRWKAELLDRLYKAIATHVAVWGKDDDCGDLDRLRNTSVEIEADDDYWIASDVYEELLVADVVTADELVALVEELIKGEQVPA